MPFANVFMIEGRTEEQKKAVIEKVTDALVEALGAPRENVRVWIQEIPAAQWGIGGRPASDRSG
jgi:4-oxalocrotonate tautomerase